MTWAVFGGRVFSHGALMQGYSIPSFVFIFLNATWKKLPFLALFSIIICKQKSSGKDGIPIGECGERGHLSFATCFCYTCLKPFFPGNLPVPCFFQIVTTQVPVAHRSSYLSISIPLSCALRSFSPECSVRTPGLE